MARAQRGASRDRVGGRGGAQWLKLEARHNAVLLHQHQEEEAPQVVPQQEARPVLVDRTVRLSAAREEGASAGPAWDGSGGTAWATILITIASARLSAR